jgi:hypothetical protein
VLAGEGPWKAERMYCGSPTGQPQWNVKNYSLSNTQTVLFRCWNGHEIDHDTADALGLTFEDNFTATLLD